MFPEIFFPLIGEKGPEQQLFVFPEMLPDKPDRPVADGAFAVNKQYRVSCFGHLRMVIMNITQWKSFPLICSQVKNVGHASGNPFRLLRKSRQKLIGSIPVFFP
jgi:hypothetical protein